jgi:hypothetical protein
MPAGVPECLLAARPWSRWYDVGKSGSCWETVGFRPAGTRCFVALAIDN